MGIEKIAFHCYKVLLRSLQSRFQSVTGGEDLEDDDFSDLEDDEENIFEDEECTQAKIRTSGN